ncbi:MAG: hypothetical protein KIH62_002480 [Candidatus Kerfeldbacteria bacterium]|nr:hypothetical protein [Candidatus Kerfeldbacteria bacterium]
MKHKLLVTLRYSESLITTIRPQFILQYSKALFFSAIFFALAAFLTYPLFRIGVLGIVIWAALFVLSFFLIVRSWLLFSLSAVYLTNERLIDVDRPKLFVKQVNEYPLSMIREVRYHSTGIGAIFAGAGTVIVVPMHESGHIELRAVSKPEAIKELILKTCKRHSEAPEPQEEW